MKCLKGSILVFFYFMLLSYCQSQDSTFSVIKDSKVVYTSSIDNSKSIGFYVFLTCDSDSISIFLDGKKLFSKECIRNPVNDAPIYLGSCETKTGYATLDILFHYHKKKVVKEIELKGSQVVINACVVLEEKKAFKSNDSFQVEEQVIAEYKDKINIYIKK